MDENRSPTPDEFKSQVRDHFSFLTTDFGMREVSPILRNEFSVAYLNNDAGRGFKESTGGLAFRPTSGLRVSLHHSIHTDPAPLSGP